jgi:KDO2-lipid IV(A) lauroyltransferase
MMRLAHRDLVPAVGAVTWSNAEALHASLRRGRGALVLSAHLGHWDAAGAALARRFGGLSVFVEPLRPAVLFDFYRRARGRHGIRVIPAGQTSRAPIEVLRHNGLLGLVADRAFGVRRERVPCGTGQLLVPAGGIRMALRAGAAIHTAFGVRRHDGFEVRVGADLRPEVRLLRDEAARVHRIGTLFAAELGQIVRLHPEQWCLLHRMDEMETTPPARRGAA